MATMTQIRRVALAALSASVLFVCPVASQESAVGAAAVQQSPANASEVAAVTGWHHFAWSSALEYGPFLGMQVRRPFRGMFIAGAGLVVARPLTRGSFFPWNRQVYFSDASHLNDTTLIFQVNQRVTVATLTVDGGVRLAGPNGTRFERFGVEGTVGVGRYIIWADPERARENKRMSAITWQLGGGVTMDLGQSTKLLARLDDMIFTNYDRDFLSLSDPLFAEDLFPNPVNPPPAKQRTIHNARITVGFTFVPGGDAP